MKVDRSWLPNERDLDWIESIAAPIHPALLAIETAAAPDRIPILDRDSGRVLATYAAGRRRIVEIGTAYGYSTLWMALAQPADGTIVTIDPDRGRTNRARSWWREAAIADERIRVVTARALEAFAAGTPELAGPFDLAFVDALKPEYPAYLDALLPRLAPGALVLADNVLWSGRTSDPSRDDDDLRGLRTFCERILGDPRFGPAGTIVPVGDGLLVAAMRA
jgi:caffeoyl-CoA O-methyltransferase